MMEAPPVQAVRQYYDGKTESILRRYGPGPRVHYHNGILDGPAAATAHADLQRLLHASQENLLECAADFWGAKTSLSGTLLDVGCGLGGGALFWAQRFGSQVTAVTNVARHVDLISGFAREAGVGDRVRPLLCDASAIPEAPTYDAAVALDSLCHMPREAVFERLRCAVKHGGTLGISDFFYEDAVCGAGFDAHWVSRVARVEDYVDLAAATGFEHTGTLDLTGRATHFWTITLALMADDAPGAKRDTGAQRSRRAHELVRSGYREGGLRYALLKFRRTD